MYHISVLYRRNINIRLGSVFEKPNEALRNLRTSTDVPLISDITQTIKITSAYNTGFFNWCTITHDIFGYILMPQTSWV